MKRILLLSLFIGIHWTSQAQLTLSVGVPNLHSGKIGLGLDGITGSPNLLMKYFFSSQLAGELIAGFDFHSPGGDPPPGQTKFSAVTFRGGIAILYHLGKDQVSPYVGIEGVFQSATDGGFYTVQPDPKNTILGGVVFGAEYFMSDKFSLGIKQRVGVEIGLKRDLPQEDGDLKLETETLMTGRYYFN